MAGALKFDGLADYATSDPNRLRVELQRQNAKVRDTFTRAEHVFEPRPVERLAVGEVYAQFGEALICDTTNADVVVRAPEIRPGDSGKFIDLVHEITGSAVVFRPFGNQRVQASSSYSHNNMGCVRLRAYLGVRSPGGVWMVQVV